MTVEGHRRVRKLFDEALERREAERLPFLQAACAGDADVLQAVMRLLEAHGEAESFLEDEGPRRVQTIGRYVIVGELGRGAMGIVFEAIDPLIKRTVAVKTIHLQSLTGPGEAEFMRERLFREARSAGALFHPGIVIVFDVGQEGEMAFIAMERVEGPSLQQLMQSGPKLDRAKVIDILRQTAAALDYAHQNGIVHRDIKPANIMLHKGATVKIADFGIAKITTSSDHTRTGMLMGTPSYMSPEQIETKNLDGRSDQFSLAVVAYELLTGARPFQAASLVGIIHMIVEGSRPSARTANLTLPGAVDQVLARGLSKLPGDRYATCVEFVGALEEALKDRPRPVPLPQPLPAPPRPAFDTASFQAARKEPRNSRPYLLGAAAAIASLVLAVPLYKFFGPAPRTAVTSVTPPPAVEKPTTTPVEKPPFEKPATPVVERFTADPQSIGAGGPVTLRWAVTDSTKVVIDPGVGMVASSGSFEVKPPASGTYVLTAKGPGGSVSARLFVTVIPKQPPAEPKIVSFRVEPASVKRGQQFRLNWVVEGASSVTIDHGVGAVRSADSRTLTLEATTTYMLTAASKGGTVKELTTVIVASEAGPAGAAKLYDDAVAQRRARQPAKAVALFREAADSGEPRAMLELGRIYMAGGDGVSRDSAEAVRWYRKAADSGNASGMVFLGAMYAQGSGVAKDYAEAARWFRKAADAGNGAGMDGLGRMYSTGQGVPKDDAEAVRWYRKAADGGNSAAMYHLGTMYEIGQGIAQDLNEAQRLYQQAAAAGSAEAKARLTQLPGGKSRRGQVSVSVVGKQPWTDTGVILNPGDTVAVTASGLIKVASDGHVPAQSPAGFHGNCTVAAALYGRTPEPYPAPQLRCWALIGRIGESSAIFEIGAKNTFKAKAGGRFYFGINDNNVRDNSGMWTAIVTVQ